MQVRVEESNPVGLTLRVLEMEAFDSRCTRCVFPREICIITRCFTNTFCNCVVAVHM